MSAGQGVRVQSHEDVAAEAARGVQFFLDGCDHYEPFVRRADGAARRDFLADEERDRAARRLAGEEACILRRVEDVSTRTGIAQAVLGAIDARLARERMIRNLALWVMLADHEAEVTRSGTYSGTGWTPTDACRLVCVSRALWENSIRNRRPGDWPVLDERKAEETGARAGRFVRDLDILRAAIATVRDEGVRALTVGMKNVTIADLLGITPERVAQIKTGSG